MTDAVYRQWLILRAIPREPRMVSARELMGQLHDAGHYVSKRTVERDLIAMSAHVPLKLYSRVLREHRSWSYVTDTDIPYKRAQIYQPELLRS